MATARPLAIIDALLSTVDYLRISVGDEDDRWLSCTTLVGDPTARATSAATVSDVHAVLIDGHVASLLATARRTCRIGSALLWGNVAASCAASFGAFAGELPSLRSELGDRTEEFFATARPEVRDAGRLVRVGERFAWERRSCCLWYRTASAWLCEDCPLRPGSPRRARTMEDPDARR